MEVSVGFADGRTEEELSGYTVDESPLGKVYIPREGVALDPPIVIRYERHPWIEHFELDGIRAVRPKRSGYGTKNFRAFVQSLNTIYAKAYDDYAEFPDASEYFAHVTDGFVDRLIGERKQLMFEKYCGFTENLWREGDEQMCDIALKLVIPIIRSCPEAEAVFLDKITDEFRGFLGNM